MLKKFFTVVLGSIAGFWISIIAFFFIGLLCIGILVGKNLSMETVTVKNSILYLDLTGNIPEVKQPTELMSLLQQQELDSEPLNDILNALQLAADDKEIKGVYINCGGSSLGSASREEIVKALTEFKKSGKWIWAYSDNYTQGDFYVASAAEKLYLNPVGSVDVHGLAANISFYKNLLDKLGVQVQVVKVGSFKSAVEPFILTQMSDSSRLQTEVFLKSIWENVSSTMADNRGLKTEQINQWADSLMLCMPAREVLKNKVVTGLAYRYQVEKEIRGKLGIDDDEDLPFVTPSQYMSVRNGKLGNPDKKHIAVLYAVGDIVDSGNGGIVGETMVPQILDLADDDNVAALVLRVNSGGGSAFASEQIWAALEYFKEKDKPFYVSMGDYAASGGYYISCGADKIFADKNTLTGSIGIFGLIPNAHDLITDKVGVTFDHVVTNANADFPQITQPMTPFQYNSMQKHVEEGYELFTSRVAEGRNIPQDQVKRIGEGRVWDGSTALKIGLVDEIGTLRDAIAQIATKVNLEKTKFVTYPEVEDSFLSALLSTSSMQAQLQQLKLGNLTTRQLQDYLYIMRTMQQGPSTQAKMQTITLD